jgi:5,6-dimethylbenzimidazole synthase
MQTPPRFDPLFRDQLAALFHWRRDVRRFKPDPIPAATLTQLFQLAQSAPSVGLSQPWHFVTIDDPARRTAIRANFCASNAHAAQQAGPRAAAYAALKLAGLDEAPIHFAVFVDPAPSQGHGLGRLTMPETTAYSAVMAVHTIWLAARAAGLGLGWVSILDPAPLNATLDVPENWRFIGYFCLGIPAEPAETPELEQAGWEHRHPLAVLQR